jgi:hypothetical protein
MHKHPCMWLQITLVQEVDYYVLLFTLLDDTSEALDSTMRSSQHDHVCCPPKLHLVTCELAPSSNQLSYTHPNEYGTHYVKSWVIFYTSKKYNDRKCQLNVPHKSDYKATPTLLLGYPEKKHRKFIKCIASMTPVFLHGHFWKECALYSGLYGILYRDL